MLNVKRHDHPVVSCCVLWNPHAQHGAGCLETAERSDTRFSCARQALCPSPSGSTGCDAGADFTVEPCATRAARL